MVRLVHYSDVENVYDDPERAGRLAGRIRALDGPDALVVGSGDNTAPGVLPLVDRGRQARHLYRAVEADVETFGNHDFDFGPAATREVVADFPGTWVSANVYDGDDRFAAAAGVVPHTLRTVDGTTVGFFGVTDPATGSLNPQATALDFRDPYAAAREAVDALRSSGADHVVAVSHLGAGDDRLAALDVDAVCGGHVHSPRAETVGGTLLARPGVNGEAVVELDLAAGTLARHEVGGAPVLDGVADALRGRVAAAGLDEVVATGVEPMPRDHETVFGGECRVGNFVADAYRTAAGTDVGLQNSGGIRQGPPLGGTVSRADLISVVPFEEPVTVVELDGATLRTAFRQCAGAVLDFGEPHWWHGHVSGARLRFDGDDLVDVCVGGDSLDPDSRYTVALADYLVHSDHEFPAIEPRHRAGEVGIQYEVLADYAREHGVSAAVEGRIRREFCG
jgi:2',3'-cyclic-nucleotide 2'-phosphodiesterase (5'-nucleotidase family)